MGLVRKPDHLSRQSSTGRSSFNNGDTQLREILDLEAMLSKEPPADKMAEGAEG